MADRKYLLKRGGVWYVRFRLPQRLGGGIFLRSLGTGDITVARKYRDQYVLPFLAGEDHFDATIALIEKVALLGAAQDKRFSRLQQGRLEDEDSGGDELTLRALADRYLAHVQQGDLSPATIQAYNSHLGGFLRIVGETRSAKSILKSDITAYRDRLLKLPVNWMRLQELPPPAQVKKTVSPAQVGNALAYVRGLFQWALDEGQLELDANPAQGVNAPFIGAKTKRPFSQLEVDAACNLPMPVSTKAFDEEAWRALPLLARYTGARLGEIAQLTGKDVVEVHGLLCLHIYESEHQGRTTKTHGDRLVPIALKIQPLVNNLRAKHGDGPLFPHCGTWTDKKFGVVKPAKAFGNAFQRIVKSVAPDLSFHSFRHYAITEMANAGVHEEVRMRIVGHKGRTVHAGYTEIDVQTMATAVETVY